MTWETTSESERKHCQWGCRPDGSNATPTQACFDQVSTSHVCRHARQIMASVDTVDTQAFLRMTAMAISIQRLSSITLARPIPPFCREQDGIQHKLLDCTHFGAERQACHACPCCVRNKFGCPSASCCTRGLSYRVDLACPAMPRPGSALKSLRLRLPCQRWMFSRMVGVSNQRSAHSRWTRSSLPDYIHWPATWVTSIHFQGNSCSALCSQACTAPGFPH